MISMYTTIERLHSAKLEVISAFFFYVLFSWLYYITLTLSLQDQWDQGFWEEVGFSQYWFNAGIRYLFLFLFSLIPWISVFIILKSQPLSRRIVILILLSIGCIFLARQSYYSIYDVLGWTRLRGGQTVWDLFIPFLLYFIQYGVQFAYEHYKEYRKKLNIENELRQAAMTSELVAIKAQLNPHFLYNVLNTVNASIPSTLEDTRGLITSLSELMRYHLRYTREDRVRLGEELAFIRRYLELEKSRYGDRLEYTIKVHPKLIPLYIPPMLLQPIIENSVRHGIANTISGGSIELEIIQKRNYLAFKISDTGMGIQNKNEVFDKGIGLSNTRFRLENQFQTTLVLEDNYPTGLIVKFELPC